MSKFSCINFSRGGLVRFLPCVLVLTILLSGVNCYALESQKYRFRIDIPDGWDVDREEDGNEYTVEATHESGDGFVIITGDEYRNLFEYIKDEKSFDRAAFILEENVFKPISMSIYENTFIIDKEKCGIDVRGVITCQAMYRCDDGGMLIRAVFYKDKVYLMYGIGDYYNRPDVFEQMLTSLNTLYVY